MPISAASDALFREFGSELFAAMRTVWSIIVAEFAVWAIAMQVPDFCPNWRTASQAAEFEHSTPSVHAFEFGGRFSVEVSEFWDVAFTLRALDATSRLGVTERFDFFAGIRFAVHARVVQHV